MNLQQG